MSAARFCKKAAVVGISLSLLLGTSAGPAGAAAESDTISFLAFPFNSCNGEFVGASGTAHLVQMVQKDGTFVQHVNFHVTVVGSLGNEYVLNSQIRFRNGSQGFFLISRELVVSKGAEPNQLQQLNFRVSFDPFSFEFVSVTDCRGAR